MKRASLCGWIEYIATNRMLGMVSIVALRLVAGMASASGIKTTRVSGLIINLGSELAKYVYQGDTPHSEDEP